MTRLKSIATSRTRLLLLLALVLIIIFYLNNDDPRRAIGRKMASAIRRRCKNKRVYIYDLPNKFNQDLVTECMALAEGEQRCRDLENWGYGPPLTDEDDSFFEGGQWWATHPHSLELIFHQRLETHLCITTDPDVADLFYVPFYASLESEQHLARGTQPPKSVMDKLAEELGVWLSDQPAFQRYGGMDHFMALGSPTWAFRRDDSHNDTWGSKLEYVAHVDKLFKLEVERHGYTPGRSMGVPYPIAFHPRLAGDVRSWQARVRASDRTLRWSYAGMPPGTEDELKETRNLIHKQCSESLSPCQHLDCSVEGACSLPNRMKFHLSSQFSVQPRGATFTSPSVFEALLSGAIPIFLWKETAHLQYRWHLPEQEEEYSQYIPFDDLPVWTKIDEFIAKIPAETVRRMQESIAALIPHLLYMHPERGALSKVRDAIDVALDGAAQEWVKEKSDGQLQPKVVGSLKEEGRKKGKEGGEVGALDTSENGNGRSGRRRLRLRL